VSDAGPQRSVRLATALVLLGIFALGALLGAGLMRWASPPPGPMGPPPVGPWDLERLDLSAEQREAAQAVFERHRPQLDEVLHGTFPRVRAIGERIEAEVRELLTPEQQARFDARRQSREHALPPPGHFPHRPGPPAGARPGARPGPPFAPPFGTPRSQLGPLGHPSADAGR
jgi:Spy/CpxP family protein refolding chaperone